MSVEIKWNRSPQQIADRIFDDAAMTYTHTRLHAYCSDYVPMDSGALDQTVDITPECVHYKQPYARRQWEGKGIKYSTDKHPLATSHWVLEGFISPPTKHPTGKELHHSQDKHPLATSHWEVAAMAAHKGDLCRDIENYLRKK